MGPRAGLGLSTAELSAGSGDGELAVSTPVSGLMAGRTYYVQLVATSADGTVRTGAMGSFETVAGPVAVGVGAIDVTTSSATLVGVDRHPRPPQAPIASRSNRSTRRLRPTAPSSRAPAVEWVAAGDRRVLGASGGPRLPRPPGHDRRWVARPPIAASSRLRPRPRHRRRCRHHRHRRGMAARPRT